MAQHQHIKGSVESLLGHKALQPFVPLIYVAWADGELTHDEIVSIQMSVQDKKDMFDDDAYNTLSEWLDPHHPPTTRDLVDILNNIRERFNHEADAAESLVELGQSMSSVPLEPSTLKTLQELDRALGVVSQDVARDLVHEPKPMPVDSWRDLESAAEFDTVAMDELLHTNCRPIRQKVLDLLSRPEFDYAYESSKEVQRERTLAQLHMLADAGLGRIAFPGVLPDAQELGAFLSAFEALAFGDLSLVIKYGVQFGLFGGSIYFLGTQTHHQKYLADVASLALPGCFAMTELGHGSNVRNLSTTATFDKDSNSWIIHTPDELARKEWIGNAAAHAKMASVFAQLIVDGERHGVHAFLVPIRDDDGATLPGVFIDDCGHKMGLNGVDNGRLWFDHVSIPAENLLDRFASMSKEGVYSSPIASEGKRFFTMLGTLVGGRVSIANASLAVSKSALTIAIRYAAMRRQFGPSGQPETPILNFRTHQVRLMPLLAKTYALSFAMQYMTSRFIHKTEEDEREVEALAAGFKAMSSWHATHTIQVARECCGGQGYLSVNRFAALKADSDIFSTFEGDNTVLLQLVAKSLLSDYAQQFQDLNFRSTLRFITKRASAVLNELDPVTSRRTDREHLRDLSYYAMLMNHREQMLLASVATRFKRRLDAQMNSFDALIEVQDHLISTAKAHVERVVLEQFIARIDSMTNTSLQKPLRALAALYALDNISRSMAWFMENSLIEPNKARAMRTEINDLCFEIRQQSVHFVASFGIPDAVLRAPIAHSTIVASDVDTHTH